MFYEYSDDLVTVEADSISENFLTVGFINSESAENIKNSLCLPDEWTFMCKNNSRRTFAQVADDCVYGTLNIINPARDKNDSDSMGFFVMKNLVIVCEIRDNDCSLRDDFLSAVGRYSPSDMSIRKFCFALFDSIISGDNDFFESTEDYVDCIENKIHSSDTDDDCNMSLLKVKKRLLHMRDYYDSIEDIAHIMYDDEIWGEGDEKYLDTLIARISRLKERVTLLSDSVVHLREAYESELELKQNRIMKIFTLVTVIFSPLSFIAGWYGMNFRYMPELYSRWGYPGVIGTFVLVTAGLFFLFKHKRWI